MDNVLVGKFICELRKEKGLSQKELANMLNITDKAVSKWETGRGAPDISHFIPLSEILGVSVYELLSCERVESNTEQLDKVIIETINETEHKGHKNVIKAVIAVIVIFSLLFSGLYAFWYCYWGNRHKFLCDIDTVYFTKIDDTRYEYEIKGTVRNWAINNGVCAFKYGPNQGGMPPYEYTAESNYIVLNGHKKSEFTIKGEIRTSEDEEYSYTNDNQVISDFRTFRYQAYLECGENETIAIDGANLFMEDYEYENIKYVFK